MGANGAPGELDFTKSDVATLVRLYDSLFGRRPDEAGLNYWIERSESGMSMQAIAAGFIDSIEAGKQPPTGNQPFVQWLYQTGLHRSGAAAEIDYWSHALDAGMSRTDLVLAFADSAEHVKLVGVIGTSIDVL
ncbi:DUF4214 domain-containing protein [Massilia solisilvae]|uniref:DUF4214 domain-containing protein n=2 Tax=Massilia solisilvae TaxID=1811225 RepID=A0ABT2BQ80_9BURK|nr:DUF4214 domain-containing protein [Massilia solisilvae]